MKTSRQLLRNGFTIIELTVVITIIGILAGITILSYGNWRQMTLSNQVKSDLNGVAAAMDNARNSGSGYPLSIPATFTPSRHVVLTYVSGDSTQYCVNGTTTDLSTVKFYVSSSTTGKLPQAGSC
ncbi:MAG: type II secretion system protein [Candidatus Saccharimonadales bacterium]